MAAWHGLWMEHANSQCCFVTPSTHSHFFSSVCLLQCRWTSHTSHYRWLNLSQSRCACVEIRVNGFFTPNVNVFACFRKCVCVCACETERVCVWLQRCITSTVQIQSSSFCRFVFKNSRSNGYDYDLDSSHIILLISEHSCCPFFVLLYSIICIYLYKYYCSSFSLCLICFCMW